MKRRKTVREPMPGAVIGFAFAGVLLVLSLLGRVELTAYNDALAEQREEVRLLEEERTQLQIAYSGMIDLEAVERYAVEELGMQKPRNEQILYTERVQPDRVTVLAVEGTAAIYKRLTACADILGECFSD